ncbi:hypothetical protein CLUG_04916 [Clavispora lusitaniae ATCC 42720]|uniref:Uncharacterized protein n=1 Tax=Clavispora lusitaniae (strain ATCC 42720) TaxID=306902 RepID=C4Y9M6_CLAL4|nr:uncharacterized protein CLUG_04916 [Clavispora lusitaniae ATCC 42720]EEQ40789.1 hypothetical protein CLUG_04916 [Clavispora lusitaniae ATCC 42720]
MKSSSFFSSASVSAVWNCENRFLNLLTFPVALGSAVTKSDSSGFHKGSFLWSLIISISSFGACERSRITEPSESSTKVSNWWKMAGSALPILIFLMTLSLERWTSFFMATFSATFLVNSSWRPPNLAVLSMEVEMKDLRIFSCVHITRHYNISKYR